MAKSPYGSLVGREPECRALERTVRGLAGGCARLIEITGDPGVGKTRMLTEIAVMRGREACRYWRAVPDLCRPARGWACW